MSTPRKHRECGGTDAFTTNDTPERSVADPALVPLPGPQADAVAPGEGAPAADPRSPSGPVRSTVDVVHRRTHPPTND